MDVLCLTCQQSFHLNVGNNTFCQHIAFFFFAGVQIRAFSAGFAVGYKTDESFTMSNIDLRSKIGYK